MNIHIHVNWIQKKVHIQYIYVEFCTTFSKSIPSNPTRSEIRSIDVSSKTKTKTKIGPSSYPINQQQQCQHYNSHWPPAQRASSSSVRGWVTARSEAARRAHHWLCCCPSCCSRSAFFRTVTAAAVKSLQEVPRGKRGEQLSKESARGRGHRRALQRVAR